MSGKLKSNCMLNVVGHFANMSPEIHHMSYVSQNLQLTFSISLVKSISLRRLDELHNKLSV